MDNMIMILSGDYIDLTLGVMLGISTLCAAAVGNIISDLAGVGLGTVIEDFASRMGLPDPKLTSNQMKLRSVRFASQGGCAVGITIGCIIGMFPLLFIDSKKAEKQKKQSGLDMLFMDVVNEAKSLVGAEATTLFLVEGDELFARYVGGEESKHIKEIRMPLGSGIAGRVALTGDPAVIYDVREEPDFNPSYDSSTFKTKSMCCVPVKDVEGRVVGVVQAINKLPQRRETGGGGRVKKGFTTEDLGILQQLGNHAAVFMQGMDEGMEELRFRDTISIIKRGEGTGKKERKRPLHMH
jgi:tRNA-specific adenosine deaminase 1